MKQSKQYTEVSTILLCCPGRFQAYFANCLGDQTKLSGIVIVDSFADSNLEADSGAVRKLSTKIRNKLHYIINPLKLIHQVTIRLRLKPYEASCEESLKAEFQTVLAKQKFPLDIPVLRVADINSPETVEFIKTHNPELICVNGTNLLREPILSLEESIPYGIVNLHTGLSPHTRGGNCNLHALLEDKPEWIGSTVHYIDSGIDSGDIICSSRPTINADDVYEFVEAKVFIEGINQFMASIPAIAKGTAPRVKQWAHGKLYLMRTGYHYHPKQRLQANQKIHNGLLTEYLANKSERDSAYATVDLSKGEGGK